jgi:hypothetical protein
MSFTIFTLRNYIMYSYINLWLKVNFNGVKIHSNCSWEVYFWKK